MHAEFPGGHIRATGADEGAEDEARRPLCPESEPPCVVSWARRRGCTSAVSSALGTGPGSLSHALTRLCSSLGKGALDR